MHGGAHETVHKNGTGFLVHFVLDRVGIHRDLNDHVEGFGHFLAGGDVVEGHLAGLFVKS